MAGPRKPTRKLPASELFDYAVKALAARAHSSSELRQKLLKRAELIADIEPVIGRLKEYGYLNDKRFAESFANSRLENRGFGKVRVLQELRGRRVAPKLAEEAVAQTFQGKDEKTLIEQYLERKYRSTPLSEYLGDQKRLAAVYRRLRRAGFSHGNSVAVLFRHAKEAAALDEMTPEEPEEDDSAPRPDTEDR